MEGVHHIALTVTNIGEAVDWYMAKFDAELAYQDDTWALLKFANIGLALVLPQQHPAHIAVVRDNAVQYGPLTSHRDGTGSAYVEDPWGNTIEIMRPAGHGDVGAGGDTN